MQHTKINNKRISMLYIKAIRLVGIVRVYTEKIK